MKGQFFGGLSGAERTQLNVTIRIVLERLTARVGLMGVDHMVFAEVLRDTTAAAPPSGAYHRVLRAVRAPSPARERGVEAGPEVRGSGGCSRRRCVRPLREIAYIWLTP